MQTESYIGKSLAFIFSILSYIHFSIPYHLSILPVNKNFSAVHLIDRKLYFLVIENNLWRNSHNNEKFLPQGIEILAGLRYTNFVLEELQVTGKYTFL